MPMHSVVCAVLRAPCHRCCGMSVVRAGKAVLRCPSREKCELLYQSAGPVHVARDVKEVLNS